MPLVNNNNRNKSELELKDIDKDDTLADTAGI